jgi:hypothetical protein
MSNVQCSVVGSRQPFTLHDRVAAAPSRWAHNLLKVIGHGELPCNITEVLVNNKYYVGANSPCPLSEFYDDTLMTRDPTARLALLQHLLSITLQQKETR